MKLKQFALANVLSFLVGFFVCLFIWKAGDIDRQSIPVISATHVNVDHGYASPE